MNAPQYTVIIQWSDEDQAYVVSLPEWGASCKTHGSTYEEAARNAREVLELRMDEKGPATSQRHSRPARKLFHYPGADVVNLPDTGVEAGAGQSPAKNGRRRAV